MTASSLALFGASPAFDRVLPVGQLYFPSWERYQVAFRGIFDREYYNNNGPLLDRFEAELKGFFRVKHAICVANGTLGLMMVADALKLSGKVILPAFTFIASAQALSWAGLEPVFCDIDPTTHQIDIEKVDALIDRDVSAIMGVNLWGGACRPGALAELAKNRGLHLFFDSAHAVGSAVDGVPVGNFGDAEVFSFHATKILSTTEGGCICTNDDGLAQRLRSIRPSYGGEAPVSILRVANARMSEAQAAVGLMSLEDFAANQANNAALFRRYRSGLAAIPGLSLLEPCGVTASNYQYCVSTVDEGDFGLPRDLLVDLLKADNVIARRYFYPGVHRTIPYAQERPQYLGALPHTDRICSTCIQFPIGALATEKDVDTICGLLERYRKNAGVIMDACTNRDVPRR